MAFACQASALPNTGSGGAVTRFFAARMLPWAQLHWHSGCGFHTILGKTGPCGTDFLAAGGPGGSLSKTGSAVTGEAGAKTQMRLRRIGTALMAASALAGAVL